MFGCGGQVVRGLYVSRAYVITMLLILIQTAVFFNTDLYRKNLSPSNMRGSVLNSRPIRGRAIRRRTIGMYHATTWASARQIESGQFRPGAHGLAGAAVYLSPTPGAACRKFSGFARYVWPSRDPAHSTRSNRSPTPLRLRGGSYSLWPPVLRKEELLGAAKQSCVALNPRPTCSQPLSM